MAQFLMPNPGADSVEDIDSEIEQLLVTFRELKSRRNARVPISKVIPDLLLNIFMLARAEALLVDPLNRQWLAISQICRSWRSITLNHPPFWSQIDVVSQRKRWARALLARSGSVCSLTLVSRLQFQGSVEFVERIVDLGPRLKSLIISPEIDWHNGQSERRLVIQSDPDLADAVVGHVTCLQTSILESLSVTGLGSEPLFTFDIDDPFFRGCFRALKHLYIQDYEVAKIPLADPQVATTLSNIRSLSIVYHLEGRRYYPKLNHLDDILERVRNVEEITLINATPNHEENSLSPNLLLDTSDDRVLPTYSCLRKTTICDKPSNIIKLLRLLQPSQGVVNVTCKIASWPLVDIDAARVILPPLGQAASRIKSGYPFKRVTVRLASRTTKRQTMNYIIIKAWSTNACLNWDSQSIEATTRPTQPCISIIMELLYAQNMLCNEFLSDVLQVLDIRAVPVVVALRHWYFGEDALQPLFTSELSCRMLFVDLKDFLHHIALGTVDKRSALANIKTLGLLIEEGGYCAGQDQGRIAQWISTRKAEGTEIDTLILAFTDENLGKEHVAWANSFRKLVGDVCVWTTLSNVLGDLENTF